MNTTILTDVPRLGNFERWLSLWIALAIGGGIARQPKGLLIMVVAFAPIVGFLLGVTDGALPWQTLLVAFTNRTRARFPER